MSMKHTIYKSIVKLLNLCLTLGVLIIPACNSKKDTAKRDPNAYYASIEKSGNNDVIICDVNKISKKIKYPLSELVDNCEMIYLETIDASLLPELRRYAVSDNYLCVAGFEASVKLFKRDGSYVCDIGRIGRGPGEYNFVPYQIILAEKNNRILLVPAGNVDNILYYDLKGNYLGSIPLHYKSPKAKIRIDGDTITVMSMVFDERIPVVYQQTFDGKLIQQLPIIKSIVARADYSNEIISSIGPHFDFQIISVDTLFHYNSKQNKLVPMLVLSPFSQKTGEILRELPGFYFGYIYIKLSDSKFDCLNVIIDKKSLKSSFYEVVNDYYGGISIGSLNGCYGDMFIASTPAIKLIEDVKKILEKSDTDPETKQKLKEILSRVHENDNDVVFVGKLKQSGS